VIGSRPRIGISSAFFHPEEQRAIFAGKTLLYLEQSMAWWVQSAGALAYLVPTVDPDGPLAPDDHVADLDGLLLLGGSDVCPRSYGEEPLRPQWEGDERRDGYEIELLGRFMAAGKPVLGICRGAQILNVALGGTLYQDITEQLAGRVLPGAGGDEVLVHRSQELYDRNVHDLDVVAGSGLARLYPGRSTVRVNSIHHQAVKDVSPAVVVEATSSADGVVEAIRWTGDGYAFGVQWHPEFFRGVDDGTMLDNRPILDEFLAAARPEAV
jgi:putative glutamine amidotransferase